MNRCDGVIDLCVSVLGVLLSCCVIHLSNRLV